MNAYEILIIGSFFVLMISLFYLSQSYIMFLWYRQIFGNRNFFNLLAERLNVTIKDSGYFAQGHSVISPLSYKNLGNSSKSNFSFCYNIISFKGQGCRWEIFSYIIKEGLSYGEVVCIRCFPDRIISQEASIERVRGLVSIFSSSRFLSEILEQKYLMSGFEWLIRKDSDSLLIHNNSIVFKTFSDEKIMKVDKMMRILKVMQTIKKEVFDKKTLKL